MSKYSYEQPLETAKLVVDKHMSCGAGFAIPSRKLSLTDDAMVNVGSESYRVFLYDKR